MIRYAQIAIAGAGLRRSFGGPMESCRPVSPTPDAAVRLRSDHHDLSQLLEALDDERKFRVSTTPER
jgi:hypothetical protein